MAVVFLGLGSNIERERYISAGLDALERLFGELDLSPVYDSPAIGFDGQPFFNLVVRVRTDLPLAQLATTLRHLETEFGRPPNATRYSARQLDIDILTYDDLVGAFGAVTLPRDEILRHAFVLRPLAELAPDITHPLDGRSYAQLWRAFDSAAQPTRRVDFSWRGRLISRAG
ncbi:MAG: 2-amino-4-hydroxy-6-hydroxymethyldihydropteridine diphosphokinase [Halioglobus sp.]|nr:2-amino-4-hydroxy-6-hydroxymethyldihydropteridine diphosphokinase [Halioglobus sp.]|tara:strand:- start:709 stop:1224 length:516 start_codon:yes stop_codon:yes gene_type:complete